jgi:2-oxoisovalerate dehydrogenase E2 component (dihydrolipoyl transacylase)
MGHYQFRLPDIGEGVAEAEIVAWHVKVGDHIREDQPLLDVMTDKATVDMSSPVDGTVTALHGEIGHKAPVGSVLVELDLGGKEEIAAPPAQNGDGKALSASPATRRRAREWGIALDQIQGSGPNGRILTEDLEQYRAHTPRVREGADVEEIKVIGLRRQIAERMARSKREIPHFSYVEECDVTELEKLRAELNAGRGEGRPKLTLLPFLMRALVKLVPAFPDLNAHYDEGAGVLRRYAGLHIGIATQTPNGLMVPVIRHAERRGLWDCAAELTRVAEAAREGRASREELSGSTITLTSLGPLGGIAATPIINAPEVAIIGPNRIVERPVVEGAFLARRKIMNLSSSFDHRIVDGHEAARFIQQLKRLLEHPALIFLD